MRNSWNKAKTEYMQRLQYLFPGDLKSVRRPDITPVYRCLNQWTTLNLLLLRLTFSLWVWFRCVDGRHILINNLYLFTSTCCDLSSHPIFDWNCTDHGIISLTVPHHHFSRPTRNTAVAYFCNTSAELLHRLKKKSWNLTQGDKKINKDSKTLCANWNPETENFG